MNALKPSLNSELKQSGRDGLLRSFRSQSPIKETYITVDSGRNTGGFQTLELLKIGKRDNKGGDADAEAQHSNAELKAKFEQ